MSRPSNMASIRKVRLKDLEGAFSEELQFYIKVLYQTNQIRVNTPAKPNKTNPILILRPKTPPKRRGDGRTFYQEKPEHFTTKGKEAKPVKSK